ncbi:peptidase C1A [Artemisia annua]|uniref:Peptidase C1A n=1 Tax=Artemisia annua TaxID=35608 RepID=A0A2U1KBG3_ARTAN|nr:peptidase C1A [Artemisia annua]
MTLFSSSRRSSFFVLFFALLSFSALAHEYSIVGSLTSLNHGSQNTKSFTIVLKRSYIARLEIFKDNLKHIDETNKKVSNYWLGLNEFADLSHEEFKNKFLGLKGELPEKREESSEEFTYRDFVDLPKSVDWRKKGAVAPVKNQGSCELKRKGEKEIVLPSLKRLSDCISSQCFTKMVLIYKFVKNED